MAKFFHYQDTSAYTWLLNLQSNLLQFATSEAIHAYESGDFTIHFLSSSDDLDVSGDGLFLRGNVDRIEFRDPNGDLVEALDGINVDAKSLSKDNFSNAKDVLEFDQGFTHEIIGNVSLVRDFYGNATSWRDYGSSQTTTYEVPLAGSIAASVGREDTIDYSFVAGIGTVGSGLNASEYDGVAVDLRTPIGGLDTTGEQAAGYHFADDRGRAPDPSSAFAIQVMRGMNHATGTSGGDYLIGREWLDTPSLTNASFDLVLESRSGSTLIGNNGADILVNGLIMRGGAQNDLIAFGDYGVINPEGLGGSGNSLVAARGSNVIVDGGTADGGSGDDVFVLPNGFMSLAGIADNGIAVNLRTSIEGGSGHDIVAFHDARLRDDVNVGTNEGIFSAGWSLISPEVTMSLTGGGAGFVDLSLAADVPGSSTAVVAFSTTLSGVEGLSGTDWFDQITGDELGNTLFGMGAGDIIQAGGGDDSVIGGAGVDTMDGGAGDDTLSYETSAGGVTVSLEAETASGGDAEGSGTFGLPGTDVFEDFEHLTGSEVNDDLEGSNEANAISGLAGDDIISGLDGNDTVYGGAGEDTLLGGAGADLLDAGTTPVFEVPYETPLMPNGVSNFSIPTAYQFDDEFVLLADVRGLNPELNPTARLFAYSDGNYPQFYQFTITEEMDQPFATMDLLVLKEPGNPGVFLPSFNIYRSDGTLFANSIDRGEVAFRNNLNLPDPGDYFIEISDRQGNPIDPSFFYYIDLSISSIDAELGTSFVTGGELLDGGMGDDTLIARDGNDTLYGGGDNDFIESGAGNDTLDGGDGNDSFHSGDGHDSISGGDGRDEAHHSEGDDTFDGGAKFDRMFYSQSTGAVNVNLATGVALDGEGGTDTLIDVERVIGSAFNDTIVGDGEDNSFSGEGGNDSIDGGLGRDQVWYGRATGAITLDLATGSVTGEGSDTLTSIEDVSGSNYGDTLLGNDEDNWFTPDQETDTSTAHHAIGGNDTVDGRGGFDWIDYSNAARSVSVNLGTGTATDGRGNTDTLSNIEGVWASDFGDQITGSVGDESLVGNGGNDILKGVDGSDTLTGGDGDDVLIGDNRGLYGTDASGQVFRLFNAAFGRNPGDDGHQNFTAQLLAGSLTIDQLAANFAASPEFAARNGPQLSNRDFVIEIFNNVLGRDPAEAGLQALTAQLDAGRSRGDFLRGLSENDEHKILTNAALNDYEARDATDWTATAYRMFEALFGRAPAQAGLENWSETLATGTPLEDIVEVFMGGAEFQIRYGTGTDDQAFIGKVFENVLGRTPADAGRDNWVNMLENLEAQRIDAAEGGDPAQQARAIVVTLMMTTQEFLNRTDAALKAYVQGFGTDDVLAGGAGNNVLSGGMFADVFEFDQADGGSHIVTDLEAWDSIDLDGFGAGFDALAALTQDEDDVVFDAQNVQIRFLDTQITDIDAGQFV